MVGKTIDMSRIKQLLQLKKLGLSNMQIAKELKISRDDTAYVENLNLVIMASPHQSNGITKAYSKAVQIGDVREEVNTAIDLKADYDATHGQLTAASHKEFMKYFFVNTVTGENQERCSSTPSLRKHSSHSIADFQFTSPVRIR